MFFLQLSCKLYKALSEDLIFSDYERSYVSEANPAAVGSLSVLSQVLVSPCFETQTVPRLFNFEILYNDSLIMSIGANSLISRFRDLIDDLGEMMKPSF